MKVAVLGATGYIGGRLVPRLLERGHEVVAVSRSTRKLQARPWATHPRAELRAADVSDPEALARALHGVEAAIYLVHSMDGAPGDYQARDRQAAHTLARVSAEQGVSRLLYLGGLGDDDPRLSPHLRSRAEVANILREGSVPVTVLRAAMIIGSGSASFEILRYLVERLPVMITPRWVSTPSQPIAVRNVLEYLLGCLDEPRTTGQTYDIGGPDVLAYRELMEMFAQEAGLPRRLIIPVPVFSPTLSSYWIHLITPVPAALAQPLAKGLRNPMVCQDNRLRDLLPTELLSCREAIRRALRIQLSHDVETHWSDAGFLPEEGSFPGDPEWAGGTVYQDRRSVWVEGSTRDLWAALVRLGGENGYYYGDFLWRLRGLMDRLLGGVGNGRGRRDPDHLYPGDALDFWRVLAVVPERRLRLLAEMKVPGQAILDFQLHEENGGVRLEQTAWFVPSGLLGILYWYAVSPLHEFVFAGMLRGIVRARHGPTRA